MKNKLKFILNLLAVFCLIAYTFNAQPSLLLGVVSFYLGVDMGFILFGDEK